MLACCCYLKNTGVAAGMSQKCTYKPDQRKKRIYTDVRFCTNSLDSSSWIIKQIHWFNFPYRSLKRLLSRLQLRLLKDSRQLIAAAAIWNPICGAHVATGSAAGRPFVCNDRVFCVRKNVKGNLTGKPAAAPAPPPPPPCRQLHQPARAESEQGRRVSDIGRVKVCFTGDGPTVNPALFASLGVLVSELWNLFGFWPPF